MNVQAIELSSVSLLSVRQMKAEKCFPKHAVSFIGEGGRGEAVWCSNGLTAVALPGRDPVWVVADDIEAAVLKAR